MLADNNPNPIYNIKSLLYKVTPKMIKIIPEINMDKIYMMLKSSCDNFIEV